MDGIELRRSLRITWPRPGTVTPAAAHTVYGGHGHALRQTLIALAAGHELAEHDSPGEATLQVLAGRVHLTVGDQTWEGGPGDFVAIPPARHALAAVEDAAVLLTVLVGQ